MMLVIVVNKGICLLAEDAPIRGAVCHVGRLTRLLGDDALCCRILFCSYRFGKREVGKSKQAQNRIMIFPGLLGDNYSTVRQKHSKNTQEYRGS